MATITKPVALDETLQAVNETLGEIKEAILPSNTYIPKVASPTAGNLASLKADGTIEDSGIKKDDAALAISGVGGLGNAIGMQGWNQVIKNGNFINTDLWGYNANAQSVSASNNIITLTALVQNNWNIGIDQSNVCAVGHNYLISFDVKVSQNAQYRLRHPVVSGAINISANVWKRVELIVTANENSIGMQVSSIDIGATVNVKNFNAFDLTELFGAGNEPNNPEKFRVMFPAEYYPYAHKSANNEVLDLKMLGWSVPKECPIQNYMDSNRVFHQRVGRVKLDGLSFTAFQRDTEPFYYSNTILPNLSSTTNVYHTKHQITAVSIASNTTRFFYPNGTVLADLGTPSGYLYYELATEVTISVDGNEMRKPFAWKFVGTARHTGFVDMSSVSAYANEYMVVVTIDGSNTVFSGVLPMAEIPTDGTYKYIKTGAYRNASVNAEVTFGFSKNRVIANRVFIDGVENIYYSINVYYR